MEYNLHYLISKAKGVTSIYNKTTNNTINFINVDIRKYLDIDKLFLNNIEIFSYYNGEYFESNIIYCNELSTNYIIEENNLKVEFDTYIVTILINI